MAYGTRHTHTIDVTCTNNGYHSTKDRRQQYSVKTHGIECPHKYRRKEFVCVRQMRTSFDFSGTVDVRRHNLTHAVRICATNVCTFSCRKQLKGLPARCVYTIRQNCLSFTLSQAHAHISASIMVRPLLGSEAQTTDNATKCASIGE